MSSGYFKMVLTR